VRIQRGLIGPGLDHDQHAWRVQAFMRGIGKAARFGQHLGDQALHGLGQRSLFARLGHQTGDKVNGGIRHWFTSYRCGVFLVCAGQCGADGPGINHADGSPPHNVQMP